jgi:ankyrin repeat protein
VPTIGHVDIVQFLLQRGTLPNTHDVSNNNVLSYAAKCDHEHLEVMRMLLVGTGLSAVITWVGLGLCAAEPHATLVLVYVSIRLRESVSLGQ